MRETSLGGTTWLRQLSSAVGAGLAFCVRQKLVADLGTVESESASFTVNPRRMAIWRRFFAVGDGTAIPHFPLYEWQGVRAFHRILRGIGANFSNILHVEWSFTSHRPLRAGGNYDALLVPERYIPVSQNRVIIEIGVSIWDVSDMCIVAHELHRYLIRNVDSSEWVRIADRWPAENCAENQNADDSVQNRVQVRFQSGTGLAYGRLSGDMNFVHTSPWWCRIFGYNGPFVQGLCTGSRVLAELTRLLGAPPADFTIRFRSPAWEDTPFTLFLGADERFALKGPDQAVVADGKWTGRS